MFGCTRRNYFISPGGATTIRQGVQGSHYDSDAFGIAGKWTDDSMNSTTDGMLFEDAAIFATNTTNGFLVERFTRSEVNRVVCLMHPDNTGNTGGLVIRRYCQIDFSNSMFELLGGEYYDRSLHLCTFTNVLDFSASGAPTKVDVFPNWLNQGLAYEDPRDAVNDGQPASAARMWIDPAGAWNTAAQNSLIGPAWLRDGVNA